MYFTAKDSCYLVEAKTRKLFLEVFVHQLVSLHLYQSVVFINTFIVVVIIIAIIAVIIIIAIIVIFVIIAYHCHQFDCILIIAHLLLVLPLHVFEEPATKLQRVSGSYELRLRFLIIDNSCNVSITFSNKYIYGIFSNCMEFPCFTSNGGI